MLNRAIKWFRNFVLDSFRKRPLKYKYKIVKELPQYPKKNVFYVEGDKINNDFWYGQMICPCGCKDILTLNLIDDISPRWNVSFRKGEISITPSIWRTKNCKSHFWLNNGAIKWV
jgi:hypothetical protein